MFNIENIAIFPFWAMMIALPDNKITKTVMGSYAVPIILGCVYIYLTWWSFSDPRILVWGGGWFILIERTVYNKAPFQPVVVFDA